MPPHIAAALLAGAALVPAAASARTVKIPEANPAVMFDVPDDWTVTPADGGFQLVAPDHTSIILAGMAKADKAGLTDWQRAAGRRMVDFGIAFDAKANPPKPPQPIAEDTTLAPLVGPATPSKAKAGELAPLSTVPSMALLGGASDLARAEREATEGGKAAGDGASAVPPAGAGGGEGVRTDKAAGDKAAGEKTAGDRTASDKPADKPADKAPADKAGKPLHFASVVIRGASLAGKPVDVQFLNFGYSKDKWFLMQQESASDDDRAGAIVKSVRAIR